MNQGVHSASTGASLNPKIADVVARLDGLSKADLRIAMQEIENRLDSPDPSPEVKPQGPAPGVIPVRAPVLERLLTVSGPSTGVLRTSGEVAEWVRSGPFCQLVADLESTQAEEPSGPGRKGEILARLRKVSHSWSEALQELLKPGS